MFCFVVVGGVFRLSLSLIDPLSWWWGDYAITQLRAAAKPFTAQHIEPARLAEDGFGPGQFAFPRPRHQDLLALKVLGHFDGVVPLAKPPPCLGPDQDSVGLHIAVEFLRCLLL